MYTLWLIMFLGTKSLLRLFARLMFCRYFIRARWPVAPV